MDAINHISSSQLKVDLDFPSAFNDSKEYVGILKTWQGLVLNYMVVSGGSGVKARQGFVGSHFYLRAMYWLLWSP